MSVRLLLKKTGVSKLDVSNNALTFSFSPESNVAPEKVVNLVKGDPNRFQFFSDRKLNVKMEEKPALDALLEAIRIIEAFN
jgi:transcription-repair coupling factor (superfamily II helicase)